jgi:hypothetical protein
MKDQIEEMKTALNNYFDNTPMELSFKHENGDTDIITDEKALGVIDAITRQALIPVFCEAIYNAGYRKQEWISVEDRLPEKYQDVLVYRDYSFDIDFVMSEGRFCIDGVTHWMPLPEPPKMKGGAKK